MGRAKLAPRLRAQLQANPDMIACLIVRVAGGLEQRAQELGCRGIAVQRHLRLISALAVRATGRQALSLAGEHWVLSIEEDREVRAI